MAYRARVCLVSLGCPKNLVDTEVMLGLLQEAGFAVVTDPEAADALIVNTCCFIAAAREESADALQEAARLRRSGNAQALVCAGCWPMQGADELRARFPEIDALMGPGDVAAVVSIVNRALAGDAAQRTLSSSPYLYDGSAPRLRATPPWTAYLKIAEGCDHRCRFCVIPRIRGRYQSRTLQSVTEEARHLALDGVKEINLIAQDTTAYGRDLAVAAPSVQLVGGPAATRSRGSTAARPDIADLLTELAAVDGLHWIRLLYAFPSRITARLIETMATRPRICKYIDVPFQHADRDALRRMGRPGGAEQFLELLERLRAAMPDIAVRSTFLVGFPGEDEAAFGHLLEFLEAARLDRVGAFVYSRERDTPAADMPDQVPVEMAQERYHRLMTQQQEISLARNRQWLGREIEVLVESRADGKGDRRASLPTLGRRAPAPVQWIGRSFRDAPEIDGSVLVRARKRLRTGEFIDATVVDAQPYDLIAKVDG